MVFGIVGLPSLSCMDSENCVVSKVTYPDFDPLGVIDLFFDSFRGLFYF
jgi:hypothetical protein